MFFYVSQLTILNIKISKVNIELIKEAMLDGSNYIGESMNVFWLVDNTVREKKRNLLIFN